MCKLFRLLLEIVLYILFGIIVIDGYIVIKKKNREFAVEREYKEMLIQWRMLDHGGYHLSNYMRKMKYNKVAIYGINETALLVIDDLRKDGIIVSYGIDRSVRKLRADLAIITPELIEKSENVDVIIVTAIQYYDEIKNNLKDVNIPIISLKEIMNSLL